MKRYYISRIVGDGSEDNPFRAKIADYNVNHVTETSDGESWALVVVEAKNHSELLKDPDIQSLPDVALDIKVTSIQKNAVDKMKVDLVDKWGIDSGFVNNQDGFRDIIRYLGRQHNENFDENNFDVSE